MKETESIRQDYTRGVLHKYDLPGDPIDAFTIWMKKALEISVMEATSMTLSTIGAKGSPSSRVVLLKGFDKTGFKFYSNYESQKGKEIAANPNVCLNFFWIELQQQIRIEGIAEKLSREESETYFQSRPRDSQLAAWSSSQSQVLPNRTFLENKFDEMKEKFDGQDVLPCPPYWGGYKVVPKKIEFWQGRVSRMHDRIVYRSHGDHWHKERCSP